MSQHDTSDTSDTNEAAESRRAVIVLDRQSQLQRRAAHMINDPHSTER